MTFGEKIKAQRKKLHMTQDDLARAAGVSRRTVTSWETDQTLPRTRKVYDKLARILNVPVSYLLNDDEAFIADTRERFGYPEKKDAEKLSRELSALFSGGDMAEEDMDALMFAVQQAYVDAKRKNKEKYTPKKYRKNAGENSE